jgi:hypothetical protein
MPGPLTNMKQQFVDWVNQNGVDCVYRMAVGDRAIKADLELTEAREDESELGIRYVRRAILRVADNAVYGVLLSEINPRDRVVINGKVWSVEDEGQSDGLGMNTLNIVFVKEMRRQKAGLEGKL